MKKLISVFTLLCILCSLLFAFPLGVYAQENLTERTLGKDEVLANAIVMENDKAVDVNAGRCSVIAFSVNPSLLQSNTFTIKLDEGALLDIPENTKLATVADWYEQEYVEDDFGADNYPVEKIACDAEQGTISMTVPKNLPEGTFTFRLPVYVSMQYKDCRELKLYVENFSVIAINVLNPFVATYNTNTLQVGQQNQAVAEGPTITETDKTRFQIGNLFLEIVKGQKKEDGFQLDELGNVSTNGDLKRNYIDIDLKNNVIIQKVSQSASSITFEMLEFTVDRTVPEGFYDLRISGSALCDKEWDGLILKDFIAVGAAARQPIDVTNQTAFLVTGGKEYSLVANQPAKDDFAFVCTKISIKDSNIYQKFILPNSALDKNKVFSTEDMKIKKSGASYTDFDSVRVVTTLANCLAGETITVLHESEDQTLERYAIESDGQCVELSLARFSPFLFYQGEIPQKLVNDYNAAVLATKATETTQTNLPKTGDSTNSAFFMVPALSALLALCWLRRKAANGFVPKN